MTGFSIDLASRMAFHGVIADHGDRAVGDEAAQDQAGQQAGQVQTGPAGPRADALVAGAVALAEGTDRPKEVGDGASPWGQAHRRQQ